MRPADLLSSERRIATDVVIENTDIIGPPKPARQVPGVYHLANGGIVVTALNDGMFGGMLDFLDYVTGVRRDKLVAMHRATYRAVPPSQGGGAGQNQFRISLKTA
jgi:hypothetical protein